MFIIINYVNRLYKDEMIGSSKYVYMLPYTIPKTNPGFIVFSYVNLNDPDCLKFNP